MRWERFFDDLEDQAASEWEAERAALDTEAERLRLSRVALRDRLATLVGSPAAGLSFDLADGTTHAARVSAVGTDWVALHPDGGRGGGLLVPLASIAGVGMPHPDLLRSARPSLTPPSTPSHRITLTDRMTFGFVLRDLVRRRTPVAIHMIQGKVLTGTIDLAGADHLDVAMHEPTSARRADAVTGHRIVAFVAIAWMRVGEPIVR